MTSIEHDDRPRRSIDPGAFGRQGFGAMRLRDDANGDADRDPVAVIGAALDAGVTVIDTADAYQNEELVGRAIRSRRDEVTLASKFGLVWRDGVAGDYDVRGDPAYVRRACDASLRRLGVEALDLYYLHTSSRTPIEETIEAMAGLVQQGKVRALGLSNVSAENLRRAHVVHPIAAVQARWSLAHRDLETTLLSAIRELGTTVVAHSPMGQGLLSGHERGGDARVGGVHAVLDDVAAKYGASAGQIALAWVHHRERVHGVRVVPIPGTTSVNHLRANIAAADLALSDHDLRRLDAHAPPDLAP